MASKEEIEKLRLVVAGRAIDVVSKWTPATLGRTDECELLQVAVDEYMAAESPLPTREEMGKVFKRLWDRPVDSCEVMEDVWAGCLDWLADQKEFSSQALQLHAWARELEER